MLSLSGILLPFPCSLWDIDICIVPSNALDNAIRHVKIWMRERKNISGCPGASRGIMADAIAIAISFNEAYDGIRGDVHASYQSGTVEFMTSVQETATVLTCLTVGGVRG